MPEPQQTDWFAKNAPPPVASATDWFAQNAPSTRPPEAQQVADRPGKTSPITPIQDLGRDTPLGKLAQGQEAETLGNADAAREWWKQGPAELGRGVREMADLSSERNDRDRGPRAFNRMVRGAGMTAAPAIANLLPMAAVEAPLATAATLGVGAAAQTGVKKGSELLGADPEQAEAYGNAAGIAATVLGPKAFRATAPARQAAAEKIVSPITYENLGETKADIRTDINPERGLTREGMVGSKKGLAEEQIPARLTELKTAANQILQNHPNGGTVIDAGPMIDQAIDNAISETEKVAGSTERLENLRTALKTKYGPTRGTPAQINDLKTEIQSAARGLGAYKNTQPVEASVASAMGQAARLIRGRVDELIPEAAELNGRMSDLIDAQAGIRSKVAGERGQSLFGNFGRSIPSTALNRTVGSAPVRTAVARVVNIGNTLDVPEPLPPRPGPAGLLPAAPLFTPPPDDTSGPVNLGAPERQPLADNRQLPAAGRTTGPQTVSGPSQFGVSLPEQTPRPLTGPERQLPEKASSGRDESFDVPLGKQWTNQRPGPIELGPSSESETPPSATPAPRTPPTKPTPKGEAIKLGPQTERNPAEPIFSKAIPNPRETANPGGIPTPSQAEQDVRDYPGPHPGDEARPETRERQPREQLGNFDADTLQEAKDAVASAHEQWQQFERPGRYVIDTGGEKDYGSDMRRPENSVYSITSARPQIEAAHPWIKNLPKLTSGKLRAAVESGKGVEYTRLLNEAAGQIQRAKEAAAPVLEEYRGQLEDAAKSVEKVDPDLAQTLRDLAGGKYAGMRGHTAYLREKLNEAATADAFDKVFSEPLSEEIPGGAQELGPEAHQPREANQQAAELGPQKTLPGLETAVQENKNSAAVELGRKLTEKVNRPAESFNSAAGEMETKSPLFRGTAASPQTEMYSPLQDTQLGPERRTAPRAIQGPDLMKTARANEYRKQLQDPNLDARDRAIIESQLSDLLANRFENTADLGSLESLKTPPERMTREQAEAATEARKAGRNQRFKK